MRPLFGLLLLLGIATAAGAQQLTVPPPIKSPVDANGVNLATGTFNLVGGSAPIGPKDQGFNYVRWFVGRGWTDSNIDIISISGTTYTVSFGGGSESFTLTGGVYTPNQGQGSTLTFNSGTNQYTYTAADGTVVVFAKYQSMGGFYGSWSPNTITRPDGVITTYQYDEAHVCFEIIHGSCVGPSTTWRLGKVWNNLGWVVQYSYALNGPTLLSQVAAFQALIDVQLGNNARDVCYGSPGPCTPAPSTTYPKLGLNLVGLLGSGTLTETDARGEVTTYTYSASGITIQRPSGLTTTVVYNGSGQVQTVSNGTATWTYAYSVSGSTETTTVTDPLGHVRTVVVDLTTDEISSDEDALSRTTSYAYDGFGRLTQITKPEGDEIQYGYDGRGNLQTVTHVPKPGSGLASIVTSASFDATCVNPVKCNKPNSTTDADGNVTNYTYDATHGVPLTVTPPAPTTGAVQPQTRYSYTSLYAYIQNGLGGVMPAASPVFELTGISACQTTAAASCPGTADEVKTTITRGATGVPNNLQITAVAKGAGDGSLTATNSMTYDQDGDVATATGPLGASQKTVFLYDFDRARTGILGPDPDGAGPLHYPASKFTYNADGLLTETEQGSDTNQSDTNWSTFTSLEQFNTSYDSLDRKAKDTLTSGGTTWNATQFSYDNANRLTCTAIRLNSAVFGSLPASACSLGTTGANGPDRITFNTYDNADEPTQVTLGYATASAANYVTTTYTNNGLAKTVLDAENNLTTYTYDGVDRLSQINFPSPTQGAGTSSATDFESYAYDAASNRTSIRRRSADTIGFTYDALNRATEKTVPSWSGPNVFYGYDLLNRMTFANFTSTSGPGVSYAYDALSRQTSETAGSLTLSSQYDLAGDRTRLTWPDSFYVSYGYDLLQRMTTAGENGAVSGIGLLATYTYDDLGDTTAITRGNTANTALSYDGADRLSTLAHSFTNTAANVSWTFAYDTANGVLSRTATNDSYTYHPGALSLGYVANGLNQYSSVSSTSYTYDARGNLTSDGTRTFTYDVENRLLTGSAPTAVTLTYDPTGRLQTSTAASATTTMLDDGPNLAGEYNSSGTLLRRYVTGRGMDQPIIWYEGSGTTDRRWLDADNQGSIVAYSDGTGNEAAMYGYSPYGEPASWSGPRYSYTGQTTVPEAQLYDYKARVYDPKLGRFLQADPVGYTSGINIYSYTDNQPISASDPTGLLFAEPPPTPVSEVVIVDPYCSACSLPTPDVGSVVVGPSPSIAASAAQFRKPQNSQIPQYCSSAGYEVSDLVSGAGEQLQNVSAGVAAGGAAVVATTWYTGAGDVAGGVIAAAGVSGYGFASALSEVGNFGKFLSGQSGAVSAASMATIPFQSAKPLVDLVTNHALSKAIDKAGLGDPCHPNG